MWRTTHISDSYRAESQDRHLILTRPNDGALLVVADGVGGRAGGGEAAQLAVELIAAHEAGIEPGDAARWAAAITYIDGEIAVDTGAGQTTLMIVEATAQAIVGASVGDSRAFFFTGDGQTIDLTQFQQRKPFAGAGICQPMSFSFDLSPGVGGTILLASDGLFDYAEWDAVEAAARHPDLDESARLLAIAARGKNSNHLYDDLTIVLCRREYA